MLVTRLNRNISYLVTTSMRQNLVNMYGFNGYILCKLNHSQQSQIICRMDLLDALINYLKLVAAIFMYLPKNSFHSQDNIIFVLLLSPVFRWGTHLYMSLFPSVHLSRSISQEPYIIWSKFLVHLCKMIISPGFFSFFQNFTFLGC